MEDKDNDIINSIDRRLEYLEKQREEIEQKYGIDENVLNSFSFTNDITRFPPYLTQEIPKARPISYTGLSKLEVEPKSREIILPYKTPEKLVESLKYEPCVKDLLDKENFVPTYTNLNTFKSHPSVPKCYEVSEYVEKDLNDDFIENILK